MPFSLFIFLLLIYMLYVSNVGAACIIASYNDGSQASIWFLGRGSSCLPFARSEMFRPDIAPRNSSQE